jgi:hypothetical protein
LSVFFTMAVRTDLPTRFCESYIATRQNTFEPDHTRKREKREREESETQDEVRLWELFHP